MMVLAHGNNNGVNNKTTDGDLKFTLFLNN